ncbi:c-type cytochrome [Flavobacterium urumqiense]|uniref:Cytochrome C oxidase, cbb3-type, subunit III n=1 Tax=Flavobacterium urumqiense TaxID=935224 RepID=A0A1H5WW96_9FLAO|nr:Cytochrome C oxidase, cbb3-type, subunit III [Flavobacterium urumqiense]
MKKYVLAIAIIALVLQGFSTLSKDKNDGYITKKEAKKGVYSSADKGKSVYNQTCVACHQATGSGIPGAFPPLAKSDYLNKDVNRAIKGVVKGLSGAITVNGKKFNGNMPAQALSDAQIADALTYVYSNWGNNKTVVTTAMVKAQRK